MKKAIKILLICILVVIILAIGGYLLMANYYADSFPYGTYINNVYCTGRTVEQVNADLVANSPLPTVRVNVEGVEYEISYADIEYVYDYTNALNEYIRSQNSLLWLLNMGENAVYSEISGETSYNTEKVREIVDSWKLKNIGNPHVVSIIMTEQDGYVLSDTKNTIIDSDAVYEAIISSIDNGDLEVSVSGVYKEPEYTDKDKELFALYEKISDFQNGNITFKLKDEIIPVNKTQKFEFVKMNFTGLPRVDNKGNLMINEDSVRAGLESVLGPYNTYRNHYFTTHDNKHVHITKGTYGNEIDIESHVIPLLEAFEASNNSYMGELEIIHGGKEEGDGKIGDTYLEICVDEQHLYYYENGKLVLDSDVVTGNHSRGYDTPQGVFDVFYMQRNRTLVGATYRSFVKYWINFDYHIGVHDASWRKDSEYGGDTYLYNGSHGCVNTPEANVSKLYEMIQLGTPVIVYSYDKWGID